MLFNSPVFLFAFLPLTFAAFALLRRFAPLNAAIGLLVGASLFYYGWWNPAFLWIILASIGVNYTIGNAIMAARQRGLGGDSQAHWLMVLGIVFNLSLLGWYKYANFVAENIEAITGIPIDLPPIVLPLAISFFTFQQIAYLVDARHGTIQDRRFLPYCLFVTFFPQLIAGPIVHHSEMMPQFAERDHFRPRLDNVTIGIGFLIIGLFKKVVIADGIAPTANNVFLAAHDGAALTLLEAWGGALAYTFQLYFDFSGYADMAVGAARLFGIVLPFNFNSPYKSASIIDFWRRWHMTLSRFLRDYLYIPLGGNRRGRIRRYVNMFVTMVLGGLWHGAGWTFIVWGALHGAYLALNHLFRHLFPGGSASRGGRIAAHILTFTAVVIGWVFFRADSIRAAWNILGGMAGANGVMLPEKLIALMEKISGFSATAISSFQGPGLGTVSSIWPFVTLPLLYAIAIGLPNSQEWLEEKTAVLTRFPMLRDGFYFALGVMGVFAIKTMLFTTSSEFFYFNF